jgi:hypothetical protein
VYITEEWNKNMFRSFMACLGVGECFVKVFVKDAGGLRYVCFFHVVVVVLIIFVMSCTNERMGTVSSLVHTGLSSLS